jgi:hypothetical protein
VKTAVIPTRNDNYGMFLAERAIQCLNCMVEVFDEVILVDWNSPHGVPMIDQIKDFVQPTGKLRCITVDKGFVAANLPKEAQPCCEVLARNVGIRRAKGDWIVSCNIDNIPTPFSEQTLDPKKIYTIAKWNVPENIHLIHLLNLSPSDKISALIQNRNILEKMERIEKYDPADRYSLVIGCGDFQAAHRSVWNTIRGFEEALYHRCFSDSNVQAKVANLKGHSVELLDIDWFHLEHKNNPYFWTKDNTIIRNNKEDAFNKYVVTHNSELWGYADKTFEESVH